MRKSKKRNPDAEGKASLARSHVLERNLAMLGHREDKERERRTFAQRMFDDVTRAAGQPWFTVLHAFWFGSWLIYNSGWIPRARPFDPFPFSFLTFVVSLEAIFLSLAILMTQNRENRQSDDRAKLDLQINLLAEQETTKILELLQALCRKQGLPEAEDPELLDLLRPTEADRVLDDLQRRQPDTEPA